MNVAFPKSILRALGLVVFGVFSSLVIVEIVCRAFLFFGTEPFSRRHLSFLRTPQTQTFKYEIKAHIRNYPEYVPTRKRFSQEFTTVSEHMDSDESILMARPGYTGTARYFIGKDSSLEREVSITIDAHHRRITPPSSPRAQHLLIMGCSMVFGDGLSDNETLPWHMQLKQNTYRVYNLGFSSYNPSLTYRVIDKYGYLENIEPDKGIAIYYLMPFHIDRFLATTDTLTAGGAPYYRWVNGIAQFIGLLESQTTPYGRAQMLYSQSGFYRLFGLSLPWITSTSFDQMADRLKRIEMSYRHKTNLENRFYVVLAPWEYNLKELAAMRESLEKKQIYFIDLSNLEIAKYVNGLAQLPDAHPNGAFNSIVADILVSQLPTLPHN